MHELIEWTVTHVEQSPGATAAAEIDPGVPVTYNHAELMSQLQPTQEAVYGSDDVFLSPPVTGAEDFSFFQEQAPGFFFLIGDLPSDMLTKMAIPNH